MRITKNDLLGRSGSPLAANQEGGVTQASSVEGSTSLDGNVTPLRTRDSIVSQDAQKVNTSTRSGDNAELLARERFSGFDLNESVNNNVLRAQAAGVNPELASSTAMEIIRARNIDPDKLTTKQWATAINNAYDEAITRLSQGTQNVNPQTEVYRALTSDNGSGSAIVEPTVVNGPKTSQQIKNERAIVQEIENQFGVVSTPTKRATKPTETFYNIYNDMGLSDGDQIRQAVWYAEPGNLVPNIIREAAGQVSVVDMSDANALVADLGINKKQNYSKTLAVLEDIIDSTPSTILGNKSGVDALELQRTVEAMASDALGTNETYRVGNNVVDKTTARNLMRIADSIGENLDKAATANNAVQNSLMNHSDELWQMRNAFPGNEKWQKMVDEKIAGATTIKQLRSSIRDLTRASIYIHSGDDNYATFGGRRGSEFTVPTSKTGVTNALVNYAANKAYNSPTAREARLDHYAKQIQNGSDNTGAAMLASATATPDIAVDVPVTTAGATATQPTNAQTVLYNAIGRNEGEATSEAQAENYPQQAVSDARAGASGANTLEGLASSTAASYAQPTAVYGALTGYTSSPQEMYLDILSRAIKLAADEGDVESFIGLYQMYNEALANQTSAKTTSDLTATQQAQLAKLDSADAAIDELESLYEQAGGAQGIIGGNFASWMGDLSLNSGARTYNQMSEGLINQIAQAIGKTDSLNTEGEVQRALQLIPQLTDDAETARNKLETLRRMLQTTKVSYNSAYGLAG